LLKALVVAPKKFSVVEVPTPQPNPGEVLIRVMAVGICGSDLHYYAGDQIGDMSIEYPLSLGHEFAGEIVAAGAGVDNVKPGDRVVAEPAIGCGKCEWCTSNRSNLCPETRFCGSPPVEGAFAQYHVLNSHQAFQIPDDMQYDAATVAEPLANLLHVLKLSNFREGDTASVIGCGPIGLLLLQLLKNAGASRVIVAEKVGYRLELAGKFGADVCIDATTCDSGEAILAQTGGRGVDVAFEAAGDPAAIDNCITAATRGGAVVIEGIPAESNVPINIRLARRKELRVQFCRRCPDPPTEAIELIHTGRVNARALISHHFPLDKIGEAFSMVHSYRDGAVKVVIAPD